MTEQELITRAEELIEAWNAGDIDRIAAAFGAAERERIRLAAEELLERFPGLEVEILRTLAAGSVVTTEWVGRTGQEAAHRQWTGVTVADYDVLGRIVKYARYLDVDQDKAQRSRRNTLCI
jgi:hypothetical protein